MDELQNIDLKQLIENETGQAFTRDNKICCPFHSEKSPSFSVRFNSDNNKWQWKCFGGCNTSGDAIDFIMQYKGMDYKAAREYLGMENKKSDKELEFEKVKGFINWQIEKTEFKKGYKLKGLFTFVNEKNEVVYYKAKFIQPDGKKCSSYYHLEGDKVVNSRGADEIPYNLYNVVEGLRVGKILITVEGEKDANTINSLFKNNKYVSTSLKGVKDFSVLKGLYSCIYVIKDTGEAGEQYGKKIYEELNPPLMDDEQDRPAFKFINLPGLKALGDNKDVTDWIEAGHDKEDLLKAFKRSLDVNSRYDLQQDFRGIYKQVTNKHGNWIKIYLTDFNLLEAKRMRYVDDDTEGVKLLLKSCTGEIIEKIGPSTVFDDVKSFKNFLGTLDLAFKGKIDDLTELKSWINMYWAIENEELHQGIKFIKQDNQIKLITNEGAITSRGIDCSIKADKKNDIEILNNDFITKDELNDLKKRIFRFAASDKTIPIIGTVINNLAVLHNQELKNKMHHLLIVGESESGKSTILSNVIATLLNYPAKDIKSIGLISNFGLIRDLSTGNYTSLYDEFKPSSLDRYKIQKLSESLRNLYDRTTITRGDKSFKNKDFQLTRPIIVAGEESYPNGEKALIDRSCIIYLSKRERTEKNTEAMMWLIKNEILLKKLGRSLIDIVINMSIEEYAAIREKVQQNLKGLNNRPLNTAINIASGIEIFNLLLAEHGFKAFEGYEQYIIKNIKEEVLEGGEETKSTVERMILLYNQMLEDGRAGLTEVVKKQGDGLYIKTSEMINEIFDFVNKTGSAEVIPLKLKDFKKQAMKAGYLIGTGRTSKTLRDGNKLVRYDVYSIERMKELNVPDIIEPDFIEEANIDKNGKIIGGVF